MSEPPTEGTGTPRMPSQPPAQTSAPPGTWTLWNPSGRSSGNSQTCMGCEGECRGAPREGVGLPLSSLYMRTHCWAPAAMEGGSSYHPGPFRFSALLPPHVPCLGQDLQGGPEGQRPGRLPGERGSEATGEWGGGRGPGEQQRGLGRGSAEEFQACLPSPPCPCSWARAFPTAWPARTCAAGRTSGTPWSRAPRPTQTAASATSSSSSFTSG